MNFILGAIVWNMQARRRYLSSIPDCGLGFVALYVASVGATEHGICRGVIVHSEAEQGFVLLGSGR